MKVTVKLTSVVDALKYFDLDSSFAQRATYYAKLGFGGTYTGSSQQNINLLNKFRQIKGYSTGGIVGDLNTIAKGNGDDTFTVNTLKKGEGIIPAEMMPEWKILTKELPSLNKLIELYDNNHLLNGTSSSIGDINIEMTFPDVTNYEQFKQKLSNDKQFKNYFLTEVNSALTGKNSLSSKKFTK